MRVPGKSGARAGTREYGAPSGGQPTARPSRRRENPLSSQTACRPVPQTDTRGRVEHTKAHGRSTVKELGKLAP